MLSIDIFIEEVQLGDNQSDQHIWLPYPSRIYTTRSAYRCFFVGNTLFESCKRVWKSWAPLNCKMFMWLASHNRCWTTDRLAPILLFVLFVIQRIKLSNTSLYHGFLPVKCGHWTLILNKLGLITLAPQPRCSRFSSWWCQSFKKMLGRNRERVSTP